MGTTTQSSAKALWLLFLVSAVTLFLELVLIRWVSTEVRIFAYLQSSVLVVCLLGMGMGCFASHRAVDLRRLFVPLVAIALLMALPFTYVALLSISTILAQFGDFHIWATKADGDWGQFVAALVLTALVLFLAWTAFIPLGQMVAGLIDAHPNTITAYSVNIFGSLVGILAFTGASALGLGPSAWFGLLALPLLYLAWNGERHRTLNTALAVAVPVLVVLASFNQRGEVLWSPYQKLEMITHHSTDTDTGATYDKRTIYVNNTGYQVALDLRPETTNRFPQLFDPDLSAMTQYDLPFLFKRNPENVLIVGAGSGNDAAGALRGGAGRVTAVEIDPAIISFGNVYHPEAPYEDGRVKVVTDDARSFIARTNDTYDLIIFGLLDSHTAGPMTNARLDHYVYTLENITRAKSLLKKNGVMVLVFEANKPYLIDRINSSLEQVFGTDPLRLRIFSSNYGLGGVMFVTGDLDVVAISLADNPRLAAYVDQLQAASPIATPGVAEVITDDWPYLYLEGRAIPALYGFMALILAAIYLLSGRLVGMDAPLKGWRISEWHFFFMGAAFMLLEVHMISKSAVALGSVWTVNAVIIGGIMGMILLANLIKAKLKRLPMRLVYALLIASCIGLYFVDLSQAAFLPYGQKVLVIAAITTLPMLFSGMVFIDSFAAAPDRGRALGANLFGALVGGMLQAITFISGMQFLLLLVAGLYLAAVLSVRRASDPDDLVEKLDRFSSNASDAGEA